MNSGRVVRGIGVGRGAVVAPLAVLRPAPSAPASESVPADQEATRAAVDTAFAEVAQELSNRAATASGALGDILAATAAMAADPALLDAVRARLRDGSGPMTAVTAAVDEFAVLFTAAGGYLAERATDLRSVRDRVVARLLGAPEPGLGALTRPSVVAGVDLAPSDTAAFDLELVVGLIVEEGGPTGHTAIIARQLGLPCVVRAAGITSLPDGTLVGVDAAAGEVLIEPTEADIERLRRKAATERSLGSEAAPGSTADGAPIDLLVNLGTVDDARRHANTPIAGSGLFRTEVLFLGRQSAPTLDEQIAAYREIIQAFGDRKVVVRTLDAGSDKPLAFATQPAEDNPALGIRGYRLVRTMPELLDTQLAALAAATADLPDERRDRLWVMAPMIATPAEARDFAVRAHAAGLARSRGHGRGAIGCSASAGHPRRGGLRLPGHQRLGAVHHGCGSASR